ncbi:hypothetical protein H9X96_10345 [Pedobacter sp. N36a]|uniref:glycosyl hydrolase family 28-related protein n=1 Tax=Pedobacter sp. N36a TaxID=2767996 RepID=UPI0016570900|nr:glycosyl hydrolase family 28-related protein [Pedobacter sp. N36a]MBC8986172.1 hypothetical protein [Pedobacter sp. N36a]
MNLKKVVNFLIYCLVMFFNIPVLNGSFILSATLFVVFTGTTFASSIFHKDVSGLNGNYLNVNMFGAKGDGVTDDTNALQKALNNGKGRTIFFPKGNYIITSSLNVLSDTELLGEGDVGGISGSAILPKGKLKGDAIFTSNVNTLSNVIFRNIRTLKSKYGFSMNVKGGYLTKVKWYNCVFQEHEVCINVEGSDKEGMYANMIRDSYFINSKIGIYCQGPFNINIIQGCGFENMKNGYLKLGEKSSSNISNSFIENRCESVSDFKGVSLDLTSATFGFYVNRNFFENSFRTILRTNGASNVDFSNNTFTSNDPHFYGVIMVNGGSAIITNNISMTGFILNISDMGYCDLVSGNGFLNFSESVKRKNLGIVNNKYNLNFNTQ